METSPLTHSPEPAQRQMSLFYLRGGLGCRPQTFLFGEFTYFFPLQEITIFPLPSGFRGFGFGEEGFFPSWSNTSSFGKDSNQLQKILGVFSVYLSSLMVVVWGLYITYGNFSKQFSWWILSLIALVLFRVPGNEFSHTHPPHTWLNFSNWNITNNFKMVFCCGDSLLLTAQSHSVCC